MKWFPLERPSGQQPLAYVALSVLSLLPIMPDANSCQLFQTFFPLCVSKSILWKHCFS